MVSLAALIMLMVCAGLFYASACFFPWTDYRAHVDFAVAIQNGNYPQFPHVLYQTLIIGMSAFNGYVISETIVKLSTLMVGLLTWIIIIKLLSWQESKITNRVVVAGVVTTALMMMMPPAVLYYYDEHRYFGYVNYNVLHNPTVFILKPIALVSTVLISEYITNSRNSIWYAFLSGAILVISCLAKPNYAFYMLPVLGLYCIFTEKKRVGLIVGMMLPTAAVMILQYAYINRMGVSTSSIVIAPMEVYSIYSQFWTIVPKTMASISFPAIVGLLYWRYVKNNASIKLAWVCFAVAMLEEILLAERPEPRSANFYWGPQISLFVLNVLSAKVIFDQKVKSSASQVFCVTIVLCVGVYSGFVYWLGAFNGQPKW